MRVKYSSFIFSLLLALAAHAAAPSFALALGRDGNSCVEALRGFDPLHDIKKRIAKAVSSVSKISSDEAYRLIEKPKNEKMGDYAVPLFSLAKVEKKNPKEIAENVAQAILAQTHEWLDSVQAVNGFLNFKIDTLYMQHSLQEAFSVAKRYGHTYMGVGQTVAIDYASPNIAKPLHVGHLRSAFVGQALRGLAEAQGYQVLGINYWGDWGVNFGLLAWAYKKWGHEYDFDNDAFESLYKLYVRVRNEVKDHPQVKVEGDEIFKRIENGDPAETALWQKFIEITKIEDLKIFKTLNIQHDLDRGESYYNSHLQGVLDRLRAASLLVHDQGADVVFVEEGKPPVMLVNSNGVSLYALRDIAAAIDRVENLRANHLIYVVGSEQKHHFEQVFSVLRKLGYSWTANLHHVDFGLVTQGGKKLSSRDGGAPRLNDVLDEAIAKAHAMLQAQNEMAVTGENARRVAVGALVFNDLSGDRINSVELNFDTLFDFRGGGPFVQRVVLQLRKALSPHEVVHSDHKVVLSEALRPLLKMSIEYGSFLDRAYREFRPSILAQYLFDYAMLAQNLSADVVRAHAEGDPALESLLILAGIANGILTDGLEVLNIQIPQTVNEVTP